MHHVGHSPRISLTNCSRVPIEKLILLRPVYKPPHFMEPQICFSEFTTTIDLSLPWARSFQSILSHPIFWKSTLILSSHLLLCLQSGLFPSGFLTKTLYAFLLSPIRATCRRPFHPSRFWSPPMIFCEEYRQWRSSLCTVLQSPVISCPPVPKHPPQHPVLTHPQPIFLPQFERQTFTPT